MSHMHEEHIPKAIPKSIKELIAQAIGKNQTEVIHQNFYTRSSPHAFFQGNSLDKVIFVNLPNPVTADHPVMVLTNPCDTSPDNNQPRAPKVTYCAIKKLSNFENILREQSEMSSNEVSQYIINVKAQYVSDIMYLPAGLDVQEERVAILSQVATCDLSYLEENFPNVTSMLSSNAYYLFLTKLSIHYLRYGDLDNGGLQTE